MQYAEGYFLLYEGQDEPPLCERGLNDEDLRVPVCPFAPADGDGDEPQPFRIRAARRVNFITRRLPIEGEPEGVRYQDSDIDSDDSHQEKEPFSPLSGGEELKFDREQEEPWGDLDIEFVDRDLPPDFNCQDNRVEPCDDGDIPRLPPPEIEEIDEEAAEEQAQEQMQQDLGFMFERQKTLKKMKKSKDEVENLMNEMQQRFQEGAQKAIAAAMKIVNSF